MKMKMTGYSYDVITNTLTMTASFAKKASLFNTPEYNTVRQLRNDKPGMKIEEAAAQPSSHRSQNITFAKMGEFIKQCRDSKDRLEAFQKVKTLSKIQASPYAYVRKWFLDNYANYSEQPEFDADGFVIVKTKRELDAEKKTKNANNVAATQQKTADAPAEAPVQFEKAAS